MNVDLDDYEDILEPRRHELANYFWAFKKLNTISPCKHNRKYTPEQIKIEVLNSPKILGIIEKISENEKIPKHVILNKIKGILDEIGYNRKVWVIKILGYVLTKIVTTICNKIYVNKTNVNELKSKMGNIPVMYVPSHRSYADFILMSYILFYYNIEIPSIAAGMDFHGMKGMGSVLRNTGAFFMRRSYNDDMLYWDTFREYIRQLVIKGEKGIEFFIEGTRSRTNKTIYPRFGLLTMILKAYFNGEVPDIFFVPISINYDRIMEERLFSYELLGIPKPKESTSGFFKSLKIVKENYGNVYINFGKPISVHEIFSKQDERSLHNFGSVHVQPLLDAERKKTPILAQHIVESQQNLRVITRFNLIAIVILQHLVWKESLNYNRLYQCVVWLQDKLQYFDVNAYGGCTVDDCHNALKVHYNLINPNNLTLTTEESAGDKFDTAKLKAYALKGKTIQIAQKFIMLQLYVNPVLYYIVNPSFLIMVLQNYSGIAQEILYEEYRFLRNLFCKEFVLFADTEKRDFFESIDKLLSKNMITITNGVIKLDSEFDLQKLFCMLLEPFFISYYIVCSILGNKKERECSEKEILSSAQHQVELLLDKENIFLHPYTLNLDSIMNCLQSLTELKAIARSKRNNQSYYFINHDMIIDVISKMCTYVPKLPELPKSFIISKL